MNKLIPKIYHTSKKKSQLFLKGFSIINYEEKNTNSTIKKVINK